jgi:hypothetical protein
MTYHSFLEDDVDGYNFENVEIHFIWIFDDADIARDYVPFSIVRFDTARYADIHVLIARVWTVCTVASM